MLQLNPHYFPETNHTLPKTRWSAVCKISPFRDGQYLDSCIGIKIALLGSIKHRNRFILFSCADSIGDAFNLFNIDQVDSQVGKCNENSNTLYFFTFTSFPLLLCRDDFNLWSSALVIFMLRIAPLWSKLNSYQWIVKIFTTHIVRV